LLQLAWLVSPVRLVWLTQLAPIALLVWLVQLVRLVQLTQLGWLVQLGSQHAHQRKGGEVQQPS